MKRLAKFSLREIILLTAIVALALTLWLTMQKVPEAIRPGGFSANGPQTTIEGPLLVSYREQTSPSSTSGSNDVRMHALHFVEGAVVFEYNNGSFRRIELSRLVDLTWRAAD